MTNLCALGNHDFVYIENVGILCQHCHQHLTPAEGMMAHMNQVTNLHNVNNANEPIENNTIGISNEERNAVSQPHLPQFHMYPQHQMIMEQQNLPLDSVNNLVNKENNIAKNKDDDSNQEKIPKEDMVGNFPLDGVDTDNTNTADSTNPNVPPQMHLMSSMMPVGSGLYHINPHLIMQHSSHQGQNIPHPHVLPHSDISNIPIASTYTTIPECCGSIQYSECEFESI